MTLADGPLVELLLRCGISLAEALAYLHDRRDLMSAVRPEPEPVTLRAGDCAVYDTDIQEMRFGTSDPCSPTLASATGERQP